VIGESAPVVPAPDSGTRPDPGPYPDARPTGYTVILPPGWQQIPLREGTREAIRKIVDETFLQPPRGVSRDELTRHRIDLERRLTSVADEARRRGGVHLYLPVALRHGAPIAASFVVSEGSFGSPEGVDPEMAVSIAASGDDGYSTVTVDGALGLRQERTAPADPDRGVEYGSRRVDYVVPLPGRGDRWLIIAFSTLGGGDPDDQYAKVLVELFDAIMSTLRWTQPG
jgi:hypothetical protein